MGYNTVQSSRTVWFAETSSGGNPLACGGSYENGASLYGIVSSRGGSWVLQLTGGATFIPDSGSCDQTRISHENGAPLVMPRRDIAPPVAPLAARRRRHRLRRRWRLACVVVASTSPHAERARSTRRGRAQPPSPTPAD